MKKSKLLVLRGTGQKGKTSTLNLLIDQLIRIGAVMEKEEWVDPSRHDRAVVLKIKGKKIGIVTRGDAGCYLAEDFKILRGDDGSEGCDLYVCASHTKGSAVDYCREEFENILWQDKWGVQEDGKTISDLEILQDKVNDIQALVLRDTVLAWL